MTKKAGKKVAVFQLASLVNMRSPDAVFEEVKCNFIRFYPVTAFREIRIVYGDFISLFDGHYPGYQSCNTMYHDKTHTMDTLLALSRLIDGYNIAKKKKLPVQQVRLAMIAMLFHDAGFIQKDNDTEGTGAKYTREHITRSIRFIKSYFSKIDMAQSDFISARNMINCTGLTTNIIAMKFRNNDEKILGLMLGTADLMGQMGNRNYLEKLLLLYHEFREGNVPGYESELDLLKKTLIFYGFIKSKLENDFKGVYKFMKLHLKARYGINKDLYQESIANQIDYLKNILNNSPKAYRKKLRRKI